MESSSVSQVGLVQEHKLYACAVHQARADLEAKGWKSFWTPAQEGAKGGPSAGTAILVRSWLYALDNPLGTVVAHRTTRIFMRLLELGIFGITCVYLDVRATPHRRAKLLSRFALGLEAMDCRA